jgi:hypothetical protein
MKKIILAILLLASPAFAERKVTKYTTATASNGSALAVTAGAYTANDSVGGLLKFSNALCPESGGGVINSVMVTDKAGNQVQYGLVLYQSLPSGTFTNDAGVDPADADLLLQLPPITIMSSDCRAYTDNGVCALTGLDSSVYSITPSSSSVAGTFYGVLITDGTPTYASTSDVNVIIGVKCD